MPTNGLPLLGKQLAELNNQTSVRTCQFSYSGTLALYSTDCQMGLPSEIIVIDCRDPSQIGIFFISLSYIYPKPSVMLNLLNSAIWSY